VIDDAKINSVALHNRAEVSQATGSQAKYVKARGPKPTKIAYEISRFQEIFQLTNFVSEIAKCFKIR